MTARAPRRCSARLAPASAAGILAGLVTGNLTRIGWRKMELAGLREYFRFGAFGELASTRAGLVTAAVRRAHRERWIGPKAAVTLIGDSMADVLAAKKSRVRSIAVATGIVPADDLRAVAGVAPAGIEKPAIVCGCGNDRDKHRFAE